MAYVVWHAQDEAGKPVVGAVFRGYDPATNRELWASESSNPCGDCRTHLSAGQYRITVEAPNRLLRVAYNPATIGPDGGEIAALVGAPAVGPFVPAPRFWTGNMCGVRVPGIAEIPGGAADTTLVLSWFYDRYNSADRLKIRAAWKARGSTHVLLSWPDSRAAGETPQQFKATCVELTQDGFFPCVMLCSKDHDPSDVPAIMSGLVAVLPGLIGLVPMFCIGWELSLWLSPTQVQQLIDAIAEACLEQVGTLLYVHFQQGYFAYQQPGKNTADFWKANIGKLTGVLHQRDLSQDMPMYQARITDCLQRFAGQFNFPSDGGFGHPFDFVALEITADPQFHGTMSEAEGDSWGQTALTTPPVNGVRVMGSGNGQ